MAQNSDITAKITEATSLALSPTQMLALCDRAIAELIIGKPTASYQVNGRTINFTSLDMARGLRDYYQVLVDRGPSPYLMQPAEFG
jgi:hypothetical protein